MGLKWNLRIINYTNTKKTALAAKKIHASPRERERKTATIVILTTTTATTLKTVLPAPVGREVPNIWLK